MIIKVNKSKGFTLIEIIVVLIILGVLASVALPSLFKCIERSRASEAVVSLKHVADYMDSCITSGQSCYQCGVKIKLPPGDDFSLLVDSYQADHFRIALSCGMPNTTSAVITAVRVDASRSPIIDNNNTPNTTFDCGVIGGVIVPHNSSQIIICREVSGERTMFSSGYYYGMY